MARNAIVIKGSDFSTNKLTTVTIVQDEKPCTAIALDQNSKTVTALGSFTLTATVTPEDTTDDVIWTSSDETVATVTDGVVSIVGVGTVTITVTCGNQTATCSVNASELTLSPDYAFMQHSNTLASIAYAYATSKRNLLICNENSSGNLRTLRNTTSDQTLKLAPVLIPRNTAAITLTYGSDMRAGTIYFGWLNTAESASDQYLSLAKQISLDDTHSSAYNNPTTWTYETPSGANSFAIAVLVSGNDFSDSDTPEAIALAKGIVVKALATVPST